MRFVQLLERLNWAALKRKLFRREIESAFYQGRQYALPAVLVPEVAAEIENIFGRRNTGCAGRMKKYAELNPHGRDVILRLADRVISGDYNFFDKEFSAAVEDKLFWSRDYSTGHEYSSLPAWKIQLSPEGTDAEPAFPFMLGRLYQFTWLGMAWQFTGDEKYVLEFIRQLNSFQDKNRMGIGIQWTEPMEAAIRLINFVLALSLLYNAPPVNNMVKQACNEFVLAHAVFLESSVSFGRNRDHRHFVVLLGLLLSGVILSKSEYGRRLLQISRQGIEVEIRTQMFPDGVLYFHSTASHAIVVESLNLLSIFAKDYNIQFSDEFKGAYRKLVYVFQAYLQIGNSLPNIGDAVLGYILNPENGSPELKVKAIERMSELVIGQGLVPAAEAELTAEHFLLLDDPDKIIVSRTNIRTGANSSVGFQYGGHYILKDHEIGIFIKASDIGRRGQGPPGHNDSFTFELSYGGSPIIVDSGTNSLYAFPDMRNALRSVMHHNTAYVDMTQLAEFIGTTGIKSDLTNPTVISWNSDETEDKLAVQHYAYVRLADPVIFKRSFTLQKDKKKFKIKDEFIGGAEHIVAANLYFHESVEVHKTNESTFVLSNGERELTLNYHVPNDECDILLQDVMYSPGYGRLVKTKRIHLQFREKLPAFYSMEFRFL